jgi:hypothetical protein
MRQPRPRSRQDKRSEEGAVMMVVMLILLTATALAAVSLQSTQYELRASGYNRAALQTQYVSEAAAATTMAWVDATSMDRSFMRHLATWNLAPNPPDLRQFGEPALTAGNKQNANRTQWRQQKQLTGVGMSPISVPGATDGVADVVGTFGPRSGYVPGVFNELTPTDPVDFVVDLYDCKQLPNTAAVGAQVNQGGSGTLHQIQFYCVVTSRGRAYVPGAPLKQWSLQGVNYSVRRLTMGHDSRGTIVTPPIIQ